MHVAACTRKPMKADAESVRQGRPPGHAPVCSMMCPPNKAGHEMATANPTISHAETMVS